VSTHLQPEAGTCHEAACPPSAIAQQPAEQGEGPDGFIRDLLGGPLLEDISDADHKRGSDSEQCGDVRLTHADLLCNQRR